jgi:putative FmdB family regulatory protein
MGRLIVDCRAAMPIYEYRRPDGSTFEVMQKFSDDPLTTDPETGEPVERVFRPPAIHFKGKGFHNTDYGTRKRNREKESASSSESKGSSDGGSGGSGGGGGDKSSSSDSSSSSSSASSPAKSSD